MLGLLGMSNVAALLLACACAKGPAESKDAQVRPETTAKPAGQEAAPAPARVGAKIAIEEPIVRLSGTTGAAYLRIRSDRADRLLAVEVAGAVAELQETVTEDGLAVEVQRPEGIAIPAGRPVVFRPGGAGVVLYDVAKPADGTLELVLRFEKAGVVRAVAPCVDGPETP